MFLSGLDYERPNWRYRFGRLDLWQAARTPRLSRRQITYCQSGRTTVRDEHYIVIKFILSINIPGMSLHWGSLNNQRVKATWIVWAKCLRIIIARANRNIANTRYYNIIPVHSSSADCWTADVIITVIIIKI